MLTAGIGFLSNTYDGTKAEIFSLDFGNSYEAKYGTENIVSRRNHHHETLKTGNGLVYATYDGSVPSIFSVAYEGFGDDFGKNASVARSDHLHEKTYLRKEEYDKKTFVHAESADRVLRFFNTNNEVLEQFTVDFANSAGKLEWPRKIRLTGNVSGFAEFDGSEDISIKTSIESLSATPSNAKTIKEIIGQWLQESSSAYIQSTYSDVDYSLSQRVLRADRWADSLDIDAIGDVSGHLSFNGSEVLLDFPLAFTHEGLRNIKSSVSEMFDFENEIDDIKLSYDPLNQTIKFKIPNIYKTDKDLLSSNASTYNIGSENNRFNNLWTESVDTKYIKTDRIEVPSVDYAEKSGGSKFEVVITADSNPVDPVDELAYFDIPASDISYRGHKHLKDDIQPSTIRICGSITTERIPYIENIDWTGRTDQSMISSEKDFYPTAMSFSLFNKVHEKVDYSFKWFADFDTNSKILSGDTSSDDLSGNTLSDSISGNMGSDSPSGDIWNYDEEVKKRPRNETLLMKLSDDGDLWIKRDLTVDGNLEVRGTVFTVNSEEVEITDNFFILNADEKGNGVTRSEAGFIIKRGTEEDYYIKFDEIEDDLLIGFESNLEKVPTIKTPTPHNAILAWDSIDKIIKESSIIFENNQFIFSEGDTLKINNGRLFFNAAEILTEYGIADAYYSKTEIDDFFDGVSQEGKKKVNWSHITDKPDTYPATVTTSVNSSSETLAAAACAVKETYDLVLTKSDIGHTHVVDDITDIGNIAKMNIEISTETPPASGDWNIWIQYIPT